MAILKNNSTRCEKEVADISSSSLTQIWSNEIINQKCFPTNLKLAHVLLFLKRLTLPWQKTIEPVTNVIKDA